MVITIDVGNTNITVGVFRGDEVMATFRITTKMPRTSDEYGMLLSNLLEQNKIRHDDIEDAIIASVVPNVMHSLEGAIIKYFGINPIIVEPGTKTGIRVVTENPRQIGADRIVDAAAAYELYGGPVLVLDFGTATTYDLVDKNGAFVSGVTAPGIRISAKALWKMRKTAGDRDPQTGEHSCKRNDLKYAGRSCIWTDRTDGIYRETYDRRG